MQTLLFRATVFTRDCVVGWVDQVSDDGRNAFVYLATHKKEWMSVDDLFSVDQELRRQRINVFAAVQRAEDALRVKAFPDTTNLNLPNGPRVNRRLPKNIRDIQLHGVYRPDEISSAFTAHLLDVVNQTRGPFIYWSVYVHERIIPIIRAEEIDVPWNVRCIKTGTKISSAEPAGGAQGYVYIPAPDDLSIINKELLGKVSDKGIMRIGNVRFALGLHKMNKELWPIHWLMEDAPVEDEKSLFD